MTSARKKFSAYHQALHEIEGRWHVKGANFMRDRSNPERYKQRMRYFLSLIGSPHEGMRFIHITGTAGKGSTAMMIHEILRAVGKISGLFTSPFSVAAIENIQVGRHYIAPKDFVRIYTALKPYIQYADAHGPLGGPSYFEIFTAIALTYFKEQKCAWVVLEVGLGGTYDATNVIHAPRVTAITNISYDHTHILGKTLPKIARDKAGIIKRDSTFFTTEPHARMRTLFKKICKERGAKFHFVAEELSPPTALTGVHQKRNADLAAAIAAHLKITKRAIRRGLMHARLPCRFEIMPGKPLTILDGAHNVGKMITTAHAVKVIPHRRLVLLIAISEDKDLHGILKKIAPLAHIVIVSEFRITVKNSYPATAVARVARRYAQPGTSIRIVPRASTALRIAQKIAKVGDMLLVTGSFYFAGELRRHWYPENFVLAHRQSFKT